MLDSVLRRNGRDTDEAVHATGGVPRTSSIPDREIRQTMFRLLPRRSEGAVGALPIVATATGEEQHSAAVTVTAIRAAGRRAVGQTAQVGEVLEARGLRKKYKDVQAVDGVDVVVHAGERVALLGPNGAGKTTTLLMLLGAVIPDSGHVEILGHRLPKQRSAAMAEVGFVAGYLPLPDRLRVREALVGLRRVLRAAPQARPTRRSSAASPASASPASPTACAWSCRRGNARSSAS